MDRLTTRDGKKTYLAKPPLKSECTKCLSLKSGCEENRTRECHYLKMIDKIAAYENTGLTPAEVAELVQAKKDGLLQIITPEQKNAKDRLASYSADDNFFDGEYS